MVLFFLLKIIILFTPVMPIAESVKLDSEEEEEAEFEADAKSKCLILIRNV